MSLPCIAHASDSDEPAEESNTAENAPPLWEMSLAFFSRYGPSYPAAEQYQTNIVPIPLPIYRGRFLRVGDDDDSPITTRLFRRDRIKLDIDFGLLFGADSEEIDVRNGMPDLDLLLQVGPAIEFQFVDNPVGDLWLSFAARGAASFNGLDPDWRGIIFSTELKHTRPLWTETTLLDIRVTPEWASGEFMDYYYGVAAEFATAERPEFTAKGGYLGTRAGIAIQHELSPKFEIRTGLRGGFHRGARNRDSPLFTAETTGEVYFAFLWKFWESERRAEVR